MLAESIYRRDYVGELITDPRQDPPQNIMIKPRHVFRRENNKGRAMVIGNGLSRQHPTFELMMKTNSKRPIPGYKIVYACNGAVWDINADYYVINNRVLMGQFHDKRLWAQFFLPWDMFLEYRSAHMIPMISGQKLDAGSYAAFMACFDGNDDIFLFGFDGQKETVANIYSGKPGYEEANTLTDANTWQENLATVMRAYPSHNFYRVGNSKTPDAWRDLPNFREVSYNDAVRLGDF